MLNVGYWPRKYHFLTGGGGGGGGGGCPSLATGSTLPVVVKVGHVTPHTQLEKYGVLLGGKHPPALVLVTSLVFNYSYYNGDNQRHY